MMAAASDIGPYSILPISDEFDDIVIFQICDLLNEDLLTDIKREITSVPLGLNSNDLGQFMQSDDLDRRASLTPALQKLVGILKTKVRKTVEELFKIKTKPRITATISKYTKGDYLLCHDDRLGTRAVAFVLYLSHLTEEDGGNLRFFDLHANDDPIAGSYQRTVQPVHNSLVLFRVSKASHHEVQQIYTDSERVSVNGWFHYEEENDDDDVVILSPISKSPIVNLKMIVFPIMEPSKILAHTLLSVGTLSDMGSHMKATEGKALCVNDCLLPNFFESCVIELETSDLMWEVQGPANFRFYETIPFEVEGPHVNFGESLYYINNLVDLLLSAQFMKTLSKITGAQYAVLAEKNVPPACMIEVRRWKEGNYSLLTDNDVERNMPAIEVTIFFKVKREMLGGATSDTDVSGLNVLAAKFPLLTKRSLKELGDIKVKRLQKIYLRFLKKERMTKRQKTRMNKVLLNIDTVVKEKMGKIQRYRRTRPDEFSFLTPQDNVMVISLTSKSVTRHTSYIKKKDFISDPQVCYYAVSVTYFTA